MAGVDQRGDAFGDLPAAFAQPLLLLLGPALVGDGFASKIDDRVNSVKVLLLRQA